MKVLFVVPYPVEAASTRYRVDQYLPYLRANGIEPTVSRFIASSEFFSRLYQGGRGLQKGSYYLRRAAVRLWDLLRIHRFDVVFVQKEAFPLGPAFFERMARMQPAALVYDFDDAVYVPRASPANPWVAMLRSPDRTASIIRMSDRVIAGNAELAAFARRYNRHVTVIPSAIDMERYRPADRPDRGPVTIGWVGSASTVEYLAPLAGLLRELQQSHDIRVCVVGAEPDLPGVDVDYRAWSLKNEIADLHRFDIGIMPLPDTPWTRGKGGFKAIQYMGVGLPVVASPVGINCEIVAHGTSGFLAASRDDWRAALVTLIENDALRRQQGAAGRAIAAACYSIQVNGPKLLEVLRGASV